MYLNKTKAIGLGVARIFAVVCSYQCSFIFRYGVLKGESLGRG